LKAPPLVVDLGMAKMVAMIYDPRPRLNDHRSEASFYAVTTGVESLCGKDQLRSRYSRREG